MKIDLKRIAIRDIAEGYEDNGELGGVVGYGGNLDIRPKYQREFIYKDNQRDAVIRTVMSGFPLNVLYWAVNDDGKYEMLDGQQRTISVCQFVQGDFSFDHGGSPHFFHNLPAEVQKKFYDYKLHIYFCEGSDGEKLDWFRTINVAGERLTDQELRNAVYCGSWVSAAKVWFSRTGGAAYSIAKYYISGTPNRQEYLKTAIKWHCGSNNDDNIKEYMNLHRNDADAEELWGYFQSVVNWIKATFPDKNKYMKGLDWGALYAAHSHKKLDIPALRERVKTLMTDDEITKPAGIYAYVLDGKPKHLNLRAFPDRIKNTVYIRENGLCANRADPNCPMGDKQIPESEVHADHITPWSEGGETEIKNCQILCAECNRRKSNK